MFELKIDILSYWLAGTGRGSSGSYDEKPLVDEHGIPYIPGKHLKGLLKEGLRSWESITNTHINANNDAHTQCFGTDPDSNETASGALRVSSATFEPAIYNDLKENKKRISKLFRELSSTAIDENGVAKNKSLRTLQVVIPVKLTAKIDWESTSPYANDELKKEIKNHLEHATAMLPAIGSKRTRGLGRCRISITETELANGGETNV